jgi:hypothetical protein
MDFTFFFFMNKMDFTSMLTKLFFKLTFFFLSFSDIWVNTRHAYHSVSVILIF